MSTGSHGERAHALLAASAAYRWLECTPSARLEDQFKEDEEASEYAKEGTFAHELAEVELLYATDKLPIMDYVERKNRLAKSPYFNGETVEEVIKYVDYVLDVWRMAKKSDPLAEIFIEDKLDLSNWVPEGFGTNDAVIIANETLYVLDLKFGKGVRVSAKENPQLMLYGLGALERHGFNFDIKEVSLTIHQPRIGNVSTFTVEAEALAVWGETEVKPTAALAFEGKGEFKPGAHCHFCKAAARCKALAEENLKLAKHDFAEPDTLSDEELIEIYSLLDFFTKWANKISAYVQAEALAGKGWPGYKLVEGRSVRQIADEEKVIATLEASGFVPASFLNSKLKGLTDLTKLLGKAEFEAIVGPFVVKPEGKPTLAPEDDPRPALSETYKNDFDDETI